MELLAESMQWCSTQKACQNKSFNVSNGDVFRWSEVRSKPISLSLVACTAVWLSMACICRTLCKSVSMSAGPYAERIIALAVETLTMDAAQVASEQHGGYCVCRCGPFWGNGSA